MLLLMWVSLLVQIVQRIVKVIKQTFSGQKDSLHDEFKLCINQFEEIFKDCLRRREEHKEWILNLRFPVKSSNEYLEFLENCDDRTCNEAFSKDVEERLHDLRCYIRLTDIVGTEKEIRLRQRMFLVKDMIDNKFSHLSTRISGGSLAEGLDLPGSDYDMMTILHDAVATISIKPMKRFINYAVFHMEEDDVHPGFTTLRLLNGKGIPSVIFSYDTLLSTKEGIFLSSKLFIDHQIQNSQKSIVHGPCLSDEDLQQDLAVCIRSFDWPQQASQWIFRHRKQWPSQGLIKRIIKKGCILVPIGPKFGINSEYYWRISFAMGEKQLIHSFNYSQLLTYALMKLTLKIYINEVPNVRDLICSYFLKTALFWVSEEISIEVFQRSKLFHCFNLCIDKLILWVTQCYCPNYFIPQNNMFARRIDNLNKNDLLVVLNKIRHSTDDWFLDMILKDSFYGHTYHSTCRLDLLFYKVVRVFSIRDFTEGLSALKFIESFMKSETSSFISGVCKFYCAELHKQIAQNIDLTSSLFVYKHLIEGIKSDAASGWLLCACFFYNLRCYAKTLQIAEHVLSLCRKDMIVLSHYEKSAKSLRNYANFFNSKNASLNMKMKFATVREVHFVKFSTLIPHELELDIQEDHLSIPPVVLANFLQFLCFHHMNDFHSKQMAFEELYRTIENVYLLSDRGMPVSFVILGICFEMIGFKAGAFCCYMAAMDRGFDVSTFAERRLNAFSL